MIPEFEPQPDDMIPEFEPQPDSRLNRPTDNDNNFNDFLSDPSSSQDFRQEKGSARNKVEGRAEFNIGIDNNDGLDDLSRTKI